MTLTRHITLFLGLIGLLFCSIAQAETVNALLHNTSDPVAGNRKGKVTVVEFFDYQCSHCKKMANVISSIIQSNPQVKVVFKELPMLGAASLYASRAALAAKQQGKYNEFSHALLTTNFSLDKDSIMEIAKQTGLNLTQLKKDMASKAITKQLEGNQALAKHLRINGTPGFVITKSDTKDITSSDVVLGEMPRDQLQGIINKVSE